MGVLTVEIALAELNSADQYDLIVRQSNTVMAGRQAKILADLELDQLLRLADQTRNPLRNRVIVLLSAKAGLRAAEIAG